MHYGRRALQPTDSARRDPKCQNVRTCARAVVTADSDVESALPPLPSPPPPPPSLGLGEEGRKGGTNVEERMACGTALGRDLG